MLIAGNIQRPAIADKRGCDAAWLPVSSDRNYTFHILPLCLFCVGVLHWYSALVFCVGILRWGNALLSFYLYRVMTAASVAIIVYRLPLLLYRLQGHR